MNTLATLFAFTVATATSFAAPSNPSLPQGGASKPAMESMMKVDATTGAFKGVEVNGGTASLYRKEGKTHLRVSDDFKLPTSPAPHWQIVDSKGNVYLLKQFNIVGDKKNRDIVLPGYIGSVAKVQVWCSFAEVLLGEASFAKPMMVQMGGMR
jgi:hypothetical protein